MQALDAKTVFRVPRELLESRGLDTLVAAEIRRLSYLGAYDRIEAEPAEIIDRGAREEVDIWFLATGYRAAQRVPPEEQLIHDMCHGELKCTLHPIPLSAFAGVCYDYRVKLDSEDHGRWLTEALLRPNVELPRPLLYLGGIRMDGDELCFYALWMRPYTLED